MMTKVVSRLGRGPKVAGCEPQGGADLPKSGGGIVAGTCEGTEQRCRIIEKAAYFRALERNFSPGREIDDWLEAEKDVDAMLLQSSDQ